MMNVAKCLSFLENRSHFWLLPFGVVPFVMPHEFLAPFFVTGQEDKLFHAVFYGTLGYVWCRKSPALQIVWKLALVFVLGLGVEAIQAAMPHRGACFYDVMANAIGVTLAGCLSYRRV